MLLQNNVLERIDAVRFVGYRSGGFRKLKISAVLDNS
jgi:hypothetical protein